MKAWWAARKPTRRRLVQVYAALLYNAHAKGFLTGEIYTGGAKTLCVPGLNCYSCPGAVGSCPLGALQNALASARTRAPFYALGMLLLFGLVLGRVTCGFLCPVGLAQELLYKLRTPKLKKSAVTRALSYLKYVSLAVLVLALPVIYGIGGYPLPAFCKYICPAGTLEGAVGLLQSPANARAFSLLGALFTHKFGVMAALAVTSVFVFRAFCRFLCPLGAIYGLFSRVSLLGVRVDASKCTHCGQCTRMCNVDVRCVGDHECVQCGECASVCPTGAISWKGARGKKSAKKRAIAWTLALLALAGALVFFNISPAGQTIDMPETGLSSEGVPVGYSVGMLCPDFTVPLYAGDAFALSRTRGKVTVVNFWATWCGPCIGELPHFQQLADAYPDDVAVVAVHSSLVTEDVPAYLKTLPYSLPFALDETGAVMELLGGSVLLPMTVIVGRDGVIAYNQEGSVTYETLERVIAPLL